MKKHLNIRITGRVQGVFFRHSTREFCQELRLTGFAKNQADGSVYIEAEGSEKDLNKLLKWCKEGPEHAKVNTAEESWAELKNFENFEVHWR